MARTIYLKDGSTKYVLGPKDTKEWVLLDIIEEHLGKDCENLLKEILEGYVAEIDNLREERAEAEDDVDELNAEIDELNAEIDDLKGRLNLRETEY